MDPQRYYEFEKGVYTVHFPNKTGLTIEQIKSIFSEFGEVVFVNKAGDDYGYRFVKYRTEEDVLRCIAGLRNHHAVKLKMKDPNHKKYQNRASSNDNKANGFPYAQKNYENNSQKTQFHENNNQRSFDDSAAKTSPKSPENETRISNNNNNNNNIPKVDSKNHSLGEYKKNGIQGVLKSSENLQTKGKKIQDQKVVSFETSMSPSSLRLPEVTADTFVPDYAKQSCTEDTGSSTKPLYASIDIEKSSKFNVLAHKSAVSATCLDAAGSHHQPHIAEDDDIPRLVEMSSSSSSIENTGTAKYPQAVAVKTPLTVTAEEVVVANIHTDFGIHYILHLIHKHNPLSVSEMKIVPLLGLRYCIVYLQSLKQAIALEKEFDNFKLCGKHLIVLRPQTLAELTVTV